MPRVWTRLRSPLPRMCCFEGAALGHQAERDFGSFGKQLRARSACAASRATIRIHHRRYFFFLLKRNKRNKRKKNSRTLLRRAQVHVPLHARGAARMRHKRNGAGEISGQSLLRGRGVGFFSAAAGASSPARSAARAIGGSSGSTAARRPALTADLEGGPTPTITLRCGRLPGATGGCP
jgi:hypothetical protein